MSRAFRMITICHVSPMYPATKVTISCSPLEHSDLGLGTTNLYSASTVRSKHANFIMVYRGSDGTTAALCPCRTWGDRMRPDKNLHTDLMAENPKDRSYSF